MGTTVESRDLPVTPTVTRLLPSAPNPFLGSMQIRFALAEPGEVVVRVYALDGRVVRTLIDAALPAGEKSVTWDGRDEMGRAVAAGSYVVQFRAADQTQSQRVMRVR
jgi:flagellar hook assembly protein FlgD